MIAIGGTGSGSAGAAVRCCMRDGSHSARRDSSQQTMKYTTAATTSVCRMLKYIEPRRRDSCSRSVYMMIDPSAVSLSTTTSCVTAAGNIA